MNYSFHDFKEIIFVWTYVQDYISVLLTGLEPVSISAPDPKSGVFANFTTEALCAQRDLNSQPADYESAATNQLSYGHK